MTARPPTSRPAGSRPSGRFARGRPLLLLVVAIALVTALALAGVRAADSYVQSSARPVIWLAELQRAVDDEARIEVRVDFGARIQTPDRRALLADDAGVARTSELLRASSGDRPVVVQALAEVAVYQASLAKELAACESGLYTECNAVSSLLAQPEHAVLLRHLADALQDLSDLEQHANLVGAWIGSATVVLGGALSALVVVLGWRRRDHARLAEARAVARSEARFRALLQSSFDVVTVIGPDGKILWLSQAVERLFGYQPSEMVGRNVAEWVHPDDLGHQFWLAPDRADGGDPEMAECRVQHSDGTWRWVEMAITSLQSHPDIEGIVLNVRDTTERKTFQTQLEHQALHDPLTHLGNRALLRARLDEVLIGRPSGYPVSVLFIDLDGFKAINDGLGHAAGDALLVEVGTSLQRACRAGDLATRLGGDEFALLLHSAGIGEATTVAERVLALLGEPVMIAGREVRAGASIGISCSEGGQGDAETLLRRADLAMYSAKSLGKGRIEVFGSDLEASVMRRLELAHELGQAIDHGGLVLQYQPLISLGDGSFHGVEALVRWKHPTRGMIPPGEFIGMAEEMGLIVGLGKFVLESACAQMAAWSAAIPNFPFAMSINVSSRQLHEAAFIPLVLEVLSETGVDPGHLIIEITESVLVDDLAVIRDRLELLRGAGIRIAIDDFGSGYSSLSYLRRLPCDIVKIDRAFVENVDVHSESRSLTRAIVHLLDSLDVVKVAEGIETAEQLAFLTSLGVEIGQGYFLARPMDADLVAGFIAGNRVRNQPAPQG